MELVFWILIAVALLASKMWVAVIAVAAAFAVIFVSFVIDALAALIRPLTSIGKRNATPVKDDAAGSRIEEER